MKKIFKIVFLPVAVIMMASACGNKLEKDIEGAVLVDAGICDPSLVTKSARETLLAFDRNDSSIEDALTLLDGIETTVKETATALGGNNGLTITLIRDYKLQNYSSIDGQGNPIKLSAHIYMPVNFNIIGGSYDVPELRGVIINCHATKAQNQSSSAIADNLLNLVYSLQAMAYQGYLVIEPDYIGFGDTSDKMQTYLAQKLIARNCFDALTTGIEKCTKDLKIKLASGYGTYILGYSQGGGNALALARHITLNATPEQRKLINLKHTLCGAGPYAPAATFDYWLSSDRMLMSALLPMVIFGHKEVYKNLYDGIEPDDFFCNKYLQTGVVNDIRNLNLDLMAALKDDALFSPDGEESNSLMPVVQVSKLMNEASANPESKIMKVIFQSLENEDVTLGWVPDTPITFFASENDNIVPPVNNTIAYSRLKSAAPNAMISVYDAAYSDHISGQISYVDKVINEGLFLLPNEH